MIGFEFSGVVGAVYFGETVAVFDLGEKLRHDDTDFVL